MTYQVDMVFIHWEDNEDCAPYWKYARITIQAGTRYDLVQKASREKFTFLRERLSADRSSDPEFCSRVEIGEIKSTSVHGTINLPELEGTAAAKEYHDAVRQQRERNAAAREALVLHERNELARLRAKYGDNQ